MPDFFQDRKRQGTQVSAILENKEAFVKSPFIPKSQICEIGNNQKNKAHIPENLVRPELPFKKKRT